jgi:hypothetical protein
VCCTLGTLCACLTALGRLDFRVLTQGIAGPEGGGIVSPVFPQAPLQGDQEQETPCAVNLVRFPWRVSCLVFAGVLGLVNLSVKVPSDSRKLLILQVGRRHQWKLFAVRTH